MTSDLAISAFSWAEMAMQFTLPMMQGRESGAGKEWRGSLVRRDGGRHRGKGSLRVGGIQVAP